MLLRSRRDIVYLQKLRPSGAQRGRQNLIRRTPQHLLLHGHDFSMPDTTPSASPLLHVPVPHRRRGLEEALIQRRVVLPDPLSPAVLAVAEAECHTDGHERARADDGGDNDHGR